jgi:Ca2+-binding RTX toxin-like protein
MPTKSSVACESAFPGKGVARSLAGGCIVAALAFVAAVVPAEAGASIVRVEPYSDPPGIDPFGSCSRYATCPADMVAITAGSGEKNDVAVSETVVSYTPSRTQSRFVVRDYVSSVVTGPGCERVPDDPPYVSAVVCTAETIGPLELGDGKDQIVSPAGWASGGSGNDVMVVDRGGADGGEGDDVVIAGGSLLGARGGAGDDLVIGASGAGGAGNDRLMVQGGSGDAGDDVMSCHPQIRGCGLNGGAGNDMLTGGTAYDRLSGGGGRDLLLGGARVDTLDGGAGDDRLDGGAGQDELDGGAGADRLKSREDPSASEKPRKDGVDCGAGRRDHAVVDGRDEVNRCEHVTRPRRGL